jgi:hypothetical protein
MQPLPDSMRDWILRRHKYPAKARLWDSLHGAVYLLKCKRSGVCKVGASYDPYRRVCEVISGHRRYGYDLEYVWSIATNCIGRVELYWVRRWDRFRTDHRREWVYLPDPEIARFAATGMVVFRDLKVWGEWIELAKGPFAYRRRRQYTVAHKITVPKTRKKTSKILANGLDTTSE